MVSGMNRFLKMMDITFRRDPNNFRPRINKHASRKDQEQKLTGDYFLVETLTQVKKVTEQESDEEQQEEAKVDLAYEEEKKEKPKKKNKRKNRKEEDEGFLEEEKK